MSWKELLLSMPVEKQNEMPYDELVTLRANAFEEHVAAMPLPQVLKEWAALMQARYGDQVRVHLVTYRSWLVALMVVRYGEAIEHWSGKFTEEDCSRAVAWAHGKIPYGVNTAIGSGPRLLEWALIILGLCGTLAAILQHPWLFAGLPLLASALTNYMEDQMITHLFRTGVTTLSAWAATTSYSVGDIRRPTTWNNRIFECVVAGTSGGSEPSWDTTLGNETTDSGVTWICHAVGVPKRAWFVALFTAAPGETGGGTEVSGGSYARVKSIPLDANWAASSGGNGLTENSGAITFPTPTANWGSVTHLGMMDRQTSGNMLAQAALGTAKTVNNNDPAPSFAAGALDFTWA